MREVVVVVALAHEREELLSGEECRHAMAQSFGHLWQGHTDGPHAIGNVVRGHELTLGISLKRPTTRSVRTGATRVPGGEVARLRDDDGAQHEGVYRAEVVILAGLLWCLEALGLPGSNIASVELTSLAVTV